MIPKVVWADFSPFDVACWDGKDVVLDKRLRGSLFLPHIIGHELEHSRSGSKMDLIIEMRDRKPPGFFWDVARRKPLWALSLLMPVIWYRRSGRTVWGVDFSRMAFAGIFIAFALLEMWIFGIL